MLWWEGVGRKGREGYGVEAVSLEGRAYSSPSREGGQLLYIETLYSNGKKWGRKVGSTIIENSW